MSIYHANALASCPRTDSTTPPSRRLKESPDGEQIGGKGSCRKCWWVCWGSWKGERCWWLWYNINTEAFNSKTLSLILTGPKSF